MNDVKKIMADINGQLDRDALANIHLTRGDTLTLVARIKELEATVDRLRDSEENLHCDIASALAWDCRGVPWVNIIRALREESQDAGRYDTLLDELEAVKAVKEKK